MTKTTPFSIRSALVGCLGSIRLRALSIVGLLLLMVTLAVAQPQSGTWTYTYTGGANSGEPHYGIVSQVSNTTFRAEGAASGLNNGQAWTYSGTGPTKVHCVYAPGPNSPPVLATVFAVNITSFWAGFSGKASDSYGDPEVDTSGPDDNQGVSSGTHYILVAPGSSLGTPTDFTYTFPTPLANANGNGGVPATYEEEAYVLVTVTAYPLSPTINVVGPIAPIEPECLVGQLQQATVSMGSVAGVTLGYNWSVQGTDIYGGPAWGSYLAAYNWPGENYYTSHAWNPLITNTPTCNIYAGEGPQTETISCTVTLYNPSGQSIGTISPSAVDVAIQVPSKTLVGTHGTAVVPYQIGSSYYLDSGTAATPGMSFAFTAVTPPDFVTAQGYGQFTVVQLIDGKWQSNEYISGPTLIQCSGFDLDNTYPYAFNAQWWTAKAGIPGTTSDSPNQPVNLYTLSNYTITASVSAYFEMFNIYQPPNDTAVGSPPAIPVSDQVPVAEEDWLWLSGTETQSPTPPGPWTPSVPVSPAVIVTAVDPWQDFVWTKVYNNWQGEIP